MSPAVSVRFVSEETGEDVGRTINVSRETWGGHPLIRIDVDDPESVEWGGVGYLRPEDAERIGLAMASSAIDEEIDRLIGIARAMGNSSGVAAMHALRVALKMRGLS